MEDPFRHKQDQNRKAQPVYHSRLIVRFLAVGVFSLIIFISAVLSFWQKEFNQDTLIHFVPVNAVVYFYGQNSFWQELFKRPTILTNLPYNNFYQNTKFDFAHKLLPLATHTAYAKLLVNDSLEQIWLFQLRQPAATVVSGLELPPFKILDKKILVVASSDQALKIVEDVANGQTFSLASQLNSHQDQARIFISANNLQTYLKSQTFTNSKIFSELLKTDLDMSFKKHGDIWQIQLNESITTDTTRNSRLSENLPAGFIVFLSGVNLSDIFTQLLEVDSEFSKTLKQNQEVYQAAFNLDLHMVQNELLNKQSDLILFPSTEPTALGLDYILITSYSTEAALQGLEDLVKIMLAQKLPQKAIRYLPDGSSVTEFSANTKAWQWEQIDLSGRPARHIAEPELNFELTYLADKGQLFIFNSQSRWASYLANQAGSTLGYERVCPRNIFGSSYIIFAKDSQIIPLPEFKLGKTLILGKNQGCIPLN